VPVLKAVIDTRVMVSVAFPKGWGSQRAVAQKPNSGISENLGFDKR